MLNATRFKTLMQREWLQNRWTWLIAITALPALALMTLPFGDVQVGNRREVPSGAALVPLLITPLVCVMVAWATTLFMASGLARRDVQDRSIEFWMSLPSTHVEHLGALYVMHGFVFPVLALLLGVALGIPLCGLFGLKLMGLEAWSSIQWAPAFNLVWQPLLLSLPALLLAAVWMAPVVLTIMAASAWMKRLALPLLAVAATFLANFSPTAEPVRTFAADYFARVGFLLEGLVGVFAQGAGATFGEGAGARPIKAGEYLVAVSRDLASPAFAVGLGIAVGALCLLVLKRRQGG